MRLTSLATRSLAARPLRTALTVVGIALGVGAGMDYDDARMLLYLVAFLVFVAVFCWSFAASSLKRVWLVLVGGGALMTAAGWFLIQTVG